jgi:hypothetical protein
MAVNDLITFRKGTASQWSSVNPVLASGEPGYDLTNSILKIGDGFSNWVALSGIGSSSVGGSSPSYVGVRGVISTTGNLTSFAVTGGYPVGYLDLFQDGVKLVPSLDFSATDGSNVTLINSVPSGTVLEYLTMASGVSSGGGSSGLSWSSVPEFSSSPGTVGQIAYDNNYFYVATATDNWKRANLSKWPLISMNYLIVGGGGGGGGARGAGGGAGGVLSSSTSTPIGESLTVVVGAGGAGSTNSVVSQNGENSSVIVTDRSIVAIGGGGGADGLKGLFTGTGMAGNSGGSGGGGSGYNPTGSGGSGTIGQGFAGGSGNGSGEPYNGGGGGGAGGAASNGSRDGGIGVSDTFLAATSAGVSVNGISYVGGGGGAGVYQTNGGSGGSGGGGDGGNTGVDGTAGAANTGGGGGGGGNGVGGGNGGSGIVILRVEDTFIATTTGSPTVYTSGGYRYYKFTQNGTITFLTAS